MCAEHDMSMDIIKLGGSIITDKEGKFEFRKETANRLAREIKEVLEKEKGKKLIIIHGGGSFGHAAAKEFGIEDALGAAKVKKAMHELNLYVLEALTSAGLPAITFQPSMVFEAENGKVKKANLNYIKAALVADCIPVLYGDVFANKHGFFIVSGDEMAYYLGRQLKAKNVFFVANIDGVFDEKGEVIKEINRKNYKKILDFIKDNEKDVTGGMRKKVEAMLKISKLGINVAIVNGSRKNELRKALGGERLRGTRFSW